MSGIALLAVKLACAGDAIPPLDIKPGYWEITLTVQVGGPPPLPPELLAKLTPAERARIEAKAKQRAAEGPRITVRRSCLDEKERHQPSMLTFGEGQGCRQTVVNASRTRQEIRVDCGQGLSQGSGTFRIAAQDPENVRVSSDWSATDGSRTMQTISTATLRWLGPVCALDSPAATKAAAPGVAPPRGSAPRVTAPKDAPPPAAATPAAADASYYYRLGREQAGRNDFQEALRSLNRAIELDPQRATSYNARGYVYLRLQSYVEAMADFSDAIRLRPDYANALQNRAIARRHLGDDAGAAADTQRAAELENRH